VQREHPHCVAWDNPVHDVPAPALALYPDHVDHVAAAVVVAFVAAAVVAICCCSCCQLLLLFCCFVVVKHVIAAAVAEHDSHPALPSYCCWQHRCNPCLFRRWFVSMDL